MLPSSDPRALPAGFTTWRNDRKLEWFLSATLDRAATVCTWPLETLDMGRLAIWDRVRHAIWAICLRMTERRLDQEAACGTRALARRRNQRKFTGWAAKASRVCRPPERDRRQRCHSC
jgi:hypothetical protein